MDELSRDPDGGEFHPVGFKKGSQDRLQFLDLL